MGKEYYVIALITFILSAILTFIVCKVALFLGVVDKPNKDRKIHKKDTPLLGGVAIFLTFFIILFFLKGKLIAGDLKTIHWLGVFFGSFVLIFGGYLDDRYNLSPKKQIIFPIFAAILVILGGVEIEKITNPFGGYLFLNSLKFNIINVGDIAYYFVVGSDLLIIFWLMGMMYTTKLLDGIDGLVTGVTGIGSLIIFLFTMTDKYFQPDVGIAAFVLSFACLGFLVFNWHPAKIFLGEGGSLFLGFILGVLAIISGGKIAIALLILGIPILDVFWTIIRRLLDGKNPFKFADRKHLHFRLLDSGIGSRKTVLIYYFFSLSFGLCALFLQSKGKVFALGLLIVVMLSMIIGFNYIDKKTINKHG